MLRPPDPETRRAAPPGGPVSQEERLNTAESNTELQARQLRNRCEVTYCLACSLAPFVWGLRR
jgi:hypothetical protein